MATDKSKGAPARVQASPSPTTDKRRTVVGAAANVVRLVPRAKVHDAECRDMIDLLTGLLEAAKAGQMSGLVFGAAFRGQQFFCDSAGSMHRDPMVAIAVSQLIVAEMMQKVGRKPLDSVF